jgi:hypothetical protein
MSVVASTRDSELSGQLLDLPPFEVVAVDHVTQSRRQDGDGLMEICALFPPQQVRIRRGVIHLVDPVAVGFHRYPLPESCPTHRMRSTEFIECGATDTELGEQEEGNTTVRVEAALSL